ncbi:flagellar basal-body rod protein FlgF [Cellvibrio polysaccharolyticus]|uniref:Flagellar basal-body rod protein FlgF n=1 Tax=Cellvibrio polysaccharolyticus TaxID=2082724 RepID=A0A928V7R2_9GAMM|nr:flagellar basal-body rod protein FlgF [Cellvibrio polysaccharolyticus]MBE8717619.1 flagellar basal-body rod protein FlgF [Cellvibrio polysaccharolyticus]
MDKALYIAMTGARHNMLAQTNHSNNLANINTTGFRADFAQARSMPVYFGEGSPTRAYALTESPTSDFEQGPLNETGRDLDVAINGNGFIAVLGHDGTEAYTRAGNLVIDANGFLRTGNGLPVLGNAGPISLPPLEKLEVGADGTLSAVAIGQGPEAMVELDRIRLVNPDLQNIEKGQDGLFRQRDGLNAQPAAEVRLVSGLLEGSNVNAVSAFTEILSLSRQYEMQVKLMKDAEQNSEASSQLLRIS